MPYIPEIIKSSNFFILLQLFVGSLDFVLEEVNVTFEASVTEQTVQLVIVNDDVNENREMFRVMIEPVEGPYPVNVTNNTVITIEITDSDGE